MSNNGFSTEINGNGSLTRERFEDAGVPVGDTALPVATTEFGKNVRSKAFFESAIDASWQKSTQGIFDTGRWLQQAREELDRHVYNALRLPFSVRTRNRLIAIAAHPILWTHVSQLPPCWGTLYALAEIDNHDLLRAALADGRIHPGLQRKDIRTEVLCLPPNPPRGTETPSDPIATWKTFSQADKSKILDREGRRGLAALVSPKLMRDLVMHLAALEAFDASTELDKAMSLTAILRNILAIENSDDLMERLRARLKKFGLEINDVSIALPKDRASIKAWSWRQVAPDRVEFICTHCHCVRGIVRLATRARR